MRKIITLVIMMLVLADANAIPKDFVNIKVVSPSVQLDIRYATKFNFVGAKIDGYNNKTCYLTKQAAYGIKSVQDKLVPMGLSLKLYDCYRPQKAVDNFVSWAKNLDNTTMKTTYYADVAKDKLFEDGYIDAKSGHSRGSSVDLTIVPLNSDIPKHMSKQVQCTAAYVDRDPDNSLDFGTGFDCFSPMSHPDYMGISPQEKANRLLLQTLMIGANFKPLDTEWWHFTLKNEPFKNTYFDFDV